MATSSTRIPRTFSGAASFGVAHKPLFASEPMSSVLTPIQSAAFGTRTDTLVAAIAAKASAKIAYEATILRANVARDDFIKEGNADLKVIDAAATAATTKQAAANIYEAAGVDPPAAGSPTPPPAKPTEATATLNASGEVSVTWKGSKSNTAFLLQRRLTSTTAGDGPWESLPFAGGRPFVDATVPAGTLEVLYQVRAARGPSLSPWSEPAALRFTAGGAANAQLKLAA